MADAKCYTCLVLSIDAPMHELGQQHDTLLASVSAVRSSTLRATVQKVVTMAESQSC